MDTFFLHHNHPPLVFLLKVKPLTKNIHPLQTLNVDLFGIFQTSAPTTQQLMLNEFYMINLFVLGEPEELKEENAARYGETIDAPESVLGHGSWQRLHVCQKHTHTKPFSTIILTGTAPVKSPSFSDYPVETPVTGSRV